MLGNPAGPGGPSRGGLWPLAPAPAPSATSFTADGFGKCGVYSLFPGGPSFGSALYSHARTLGQFTSNHIQQSTGNPFHHKDSLFSSTGYTFGAPTPPPGSPYSPVPVAQLELFTKGFNSNIIIQQQQQQHTLQPSSIDYSLSPRKLQDKQRCDEKCCNLKQKSCNNNNQSPIGSPIKKFTDNINGCSRTNPIEWNGTTVNVKKEPGNPCQVAEITTSVSPSLVKLELTSPKNGNDSTIISTTTTAMIGGTTITTSCGGISTANTANIPIGIAVARQRYHHQEMMGSPSLPPTGLLTTINAAGQYKEVARISEIESAATAASSSSPTTTTTATTAGMAASNIAGGIQGGVTGGGASLLQCTDERNGLATWPMGGTHSSALTTPTLWQYPAPVPMEPMVPLPVPMPPVGFQLVRDPTTGGFLLLPTTGIEPLQQAVVWPSYHQPPSVLIPPLPPPPLQLLSSTTAASDYLSSSTTLHQHTQTHHSTRLVALTTDNKRKIPLPIPTTTLIKIETDATTLDQTTKTLQAVSAIGTNTGTVFTDQSMTPLVTTHVIYQHPTNLILSQQQQQQQSSESLCRSQATSPVACLTPPPETANIHQQQDDEQQQLTVQDASNQTETPIFSEDDNTNQSKHDHLEQMPAKICASISTPVPDGNEAVPKQQQQQEPEQVPEITSRQNDESIVTTTTTTTITTTLSETNKQKPDISGLELLSNSIVEFENCRQHEQQQQQQQEKKIIKSEPLDYDKDNNNLGGLDLLCALAEQRILEENVEKHHRSKERKKEKRKSKKHSDEPKRKKSKHHHHHHHHHHHDKSKKRHEPSENDCCCGTNNTTTTTTTTTNNDISIIEENYHTYKTPESEEEVRKFIASKMQQHHHKQQQQQQPQQHQQQQQQQQNCCKNDWPDMNEMELDMRMKLADLQRQYREKQKELSKLKPKKHDCVKKRTTKSKKDRTPTPVLEKSENFQKTNQIKTTELLKPPTLCPFETTTTTTTNNNKTTIQQPIKQSDRIINDYKRDLLRQRAALEEIELLSSPEKNTTATSSLSSSSSSKKRKVGRPKKLSSPSGYHVAATETIVAKKPKNNFVGYLLAAKEKLQLQSKLYTNSPPRYIDDNSNTIIQKIKKNRCTNNNNHHHHHNNNNHNNNHHNNNNNEDEVKSCKIRPKLKAELTIKSYDEGEDQWESLEEDEDDCNNDNREIDEQADDDEEMDGQIVESNTLPEDLNNDNNNNNNNNDAEEHVKQQQQRLQEDAENIVEPLDVDEDELEEDKTVVDEELEQQSKQIDNRCILTSEHLEIDKLRVLTAMGGLFYAGHLNAVQPPDVYSITLDGERGNRPHIMSREEILRDAIVEVPPKTTDELPIGTRLCAYWSQQYRCLYPGSVAEPGTPDPLLDSKFVAVEFDDGDSGRIAIEDIRLLPPDYPIIEYDPNPLLSLSKRRRRTSTSISTEERRQQTPVVVPSTQPLPTTQPPPPPPPTTQPLIIQQSEQKSDMDLEKENKDTNKPHIDSSYKERKRLKKKKKDKAKQKLLLLDDDDDDEDNNKKKKKKHRCNSSSSNSSSGVSIEGYCKHKKHHKKHRKHKKHHHHDDVVVVGTVEAALPTVVEEDEDDGKDKTEQNHIETGDGGILDEQTNNDFDQIMNPDDEVTRDDIVEAATRSKKTKKIRDRQESCESRSKMSAFLPARQLWSWFGKGYKRPRAKGRARKQFYRTIQRGKEIITVGDSAVFLSTGRPDRPYIGKIEAMWELCGTMVVRVKWFYHPEETIGCPLNLQYPGALFESPHIDENDVQTIAHKCEVLPLKDYKERLGDDPQRYAEIYDNNDIYYLAGYYDPTTTTLKIQPEIPFTKKNNNNQ